MSLDLFPSGGLDSGVLTTVLVGVWVVVLLHRRLGWVASGLVIPGFLVPLLLIQPAGAVLILLEAMLTYALGRLVCWLGERNGWFCTLFGRDRFFLLVLLSVAVRLSVDSWVLPALEHQLAAIGIGLAAFEQLQSFGLVIIALSANLFWKPGLLRGSVYLGSALGLTWLIVSQLLIPLTNYSVGSLAFIYEDVSSSVLASPKAYILLISSAFIASRMNLFYGWEFNGILLPSLLALQWLYPGKLLATAIEIGVVFVAGSALLRLPWLRRMEISGALVVGYFFSVGFAYKLCLGWVLTLYFPEVKVTDQYAFGYLLSALLAAKMYETGVALRIARATVQTSLFGAIAATVIGFGLSLLPAGRPIPAATTSAATMSSTRIADLIATQQLASYGTAALRIELPNAHALSDLETALRGWRSDQSLSEVAAKLTSGHWELKFSDEGWWVLRNAERTDWGVLLLRSERREGVLLEVPESLYEVGSADLALALTEPLQASAIVVVAEALVDRRTAGRSVLAVVHSALSDQAVLRLRSARRGSGLAAGAGGAAESSMLWVSSSVPNALPIAALEQLLGGQLDVRWGGAPPSRFDSEHLRAELNVSRSALRTALARSAQIGGKPAEDAEVGSIDGFVQSWLLQAREQITRAGESSPPVPLGVAEMLYLDNEVITPLNELAVNFDQAWNTSQQQQLGFVAGRAERLGMRLWMLRESSGGRFLVLASDRPADDPARAGLLAWRLGTVGQSWLVEVPKPLLERGAYEFAADLFSNTSAQLLLVAAAHPYASGAAIDPARLDADGTIFNLAHQVLLREYASTKLSVVQVRTRGSNSAAANIPADIVIQPAETRVGADDGRFGQDLQTAIERIGLSVLWATGEPQARALNGRGNAQMQMSRSHPDKEFAVLWLQARLERRFRPEIAANPLQAQALALGLDVESVLLADWLQDREWKSAGNEDGATSLAIGLLNDYVSSRDIALLAGIQLSARDLRPVVLIDQSDESSYLALQSEQGALLAVVNLRTQNAERIDMQGPESVQAFLHRQARWLQRSDEP